MSYIKTFFIFLFLYSSNVFAYDSAVIIMYHRFGESNYPSTNISLKRFSEHINELKKEKYNVLPLLEIISRLKEGKPLPDYTVAITMDDAFLSIYENAWPILKKEGLPFTLFVSTDYVDFNYSKYMSWDQIRELKNSGVTIGHHSKSHAHLHTLNEAEIRNEIDYANSRFMKELNEIPSLFAYPYGEYNNLVKNIAFEKFDASFGQHSGAIHPSHGFHEFSRYSMNEQYGTMDRFLLAINSLPIVVNEIYPDDPVLIENPPSYGFTLGKNYANVKNLNCFASGQGQTEVILIEKRIEIRVSKPFTQERNKINCTMPGDNKRWHWFGRQFLLGD